jgi:aspartyl protease family protein
MSEPASQPPRDLPGGLRLTIIWLLIGTALFLGIQAMLSQAERARFSFNAASGTIELKRAPDGHFHWPGRLNGVAVVFMVDTGATSTAIPRELADQLALRDEGRVTSSTAGGVVSGTWSRADLVLEGGPSVERLRVTVLPRLEAPLLGMDVLSKMRFTQSEGVLRLQAGASP